MEERMPITTRRSFLAGTAVAAAALVLPKDKLFSFNFNRIADSSSATLNIVLNSQPSGLKAAEGFLADFTKTTGIKLNLTATNGGGSWVGFFQAISTKLAGGEAIDSAYIATEGMLLFEERGVLEVEGLSSDDIGRSAASNGFVLYELTPVEVSLEEAFMALTHDEIEYRGSDNTATTTIDEHERMAA